MCSKKEEFRTVTIIVQGNINFTSGGDAWFDLGENANFLFEGKNVLLEKIHLTYELIGGVLKRFNAINVTLALIANENNTFVANNTPIILPASSAGVFESQSPIYQVSNFCPEISIGKICQGAEISQVRINTDITNPPDSFGVACYLTFSYSKIDLF